MTVEIPYVLEVPTQGSKAAVVVGKSVCSKFSHVLFLSGSVF